VRHRKHFSCFVSCLLFTIDSIVVSHPSAGAAAAAGSTLLGPGSFHTMHTGSASGGVRYDDDDDDDVDEDDEDEKVSVVFIVQITFLTSLSAAAPAAAVVAPMAAAFNSGATSGASSASSGGKPPRCCSADRWFRIS